MDLNINNSNIISSPVIVKDKDTGVITKSYTVNEKIDLNILNFKITQIQNKINLLTEQKAELEKIKADCLKL
jgi:flagellar capping protein FliD